MNIRQLFRGPTSNNCIHSSAYSDDLYFRDSLESNAPLPFDVLRGSKVNKQLHVRVDNTENINVSTYRSNPRLDSGYIRLFSSTQESIVIPQLEIDRYKWLVNAKRATLEQMSVEQRFGLRVGNVLDDSPKSIFDFDRLIYYTDVKRNSNGVYETTDDCERKQFSEWQGVDSIDEIWCNKDAYKPIIREQFEDKLMGTPNINNNTEMMGPWDIHMMDYLRGLFLRGVPQYVTENVTDIPMGVDPNEPVVTEVIDDDDVDSDHMYDVSDVDYDWNGFKEEVEKTVRDNQETVNCNFYHHKCLGKTAFVNTLLIVGALFDDPNAAYFDKNFNRSVRFIEILEKRSSMGEAMTSTVQYIRDKCKALVDYKDDVTHIKKDALRNISEDDVNRIAQFIVDLSSCEIKDRQGNVIMKGFIFKPEKALTVKDKLMKKVRAEIQDAKRKPVIIDK